MLITHPLARLGEQFDVRHGGVARRLPGIVVRGTAAFMNPETNLSNPTVRIICRIVD